MSFSRRSFIGALGLGAVALTSASALAKKPRKIKVDEPSPGHGKNDEPAEVNGGPVVLPPWPYGANSTATDAMLMFRGNPSHTFYGTGPVPQDKPKILWKFRMEDFPSLYYGEPFVWRGTGWTGQPMVYAGHVWVGSQGRNLYCFEQATGKVRWRLKVSRQIKGSGCFWDNKIYIGCVDDRLRCVDASTGKVIWKIDTGHDLDSSPSIINGKLYVAGENGHARCVDPLTGKQIWKTFVGGLNNGPKKGSYGSETSPAVVDNEFYCGNYDGECIQLDATTGEKKWLAHSGDDTDSSPVVQGDLVFFAAEDKSPYVYAFKRKDGSEVWKYKMPGGLWGTPAVVGDTLWLGSAKGQLVSLEAKTGKLKWETKIGAPTWSSPTVVDGTLLLGDFDGHFHAYDAATGTERWSLKLGGRIHSTAVIINGKIFVGTTEGEFFAIG